MDGVVRDYEIVPYDVVMDVRRWLFDEEEMMRQLFAEMSEYLVKGRMLLRAWFVKHNPTTLEVLSREVFYLSSAHSSYIHNFRQWYRQHTVGIINHLETFIKHDSNLEFDGVEVLELKLNCLPNMSGRAFFKLPNALKRIQGVINVDVPHSCFKYALLSVLHYGDITCNRQRASNYERWLDELNFGEIDASDVHIKHDVPKIEELNDIKINIHIWEKGLQGCIYNNRKVLSAKTINLLLVVGSEGERHYCGIPSLSRLYHHTKTMHNMNFMCERCIRSFYKQELLDEHYQWCVRGRLQIERLPKQAQLKYCAFHKELCPVKVVYADIESYIDDNIHYPAAIASYEVWHTEIASKKQSTTLIQSWCGEDSIIDFLQYLEDTAQTQHRHDNKMTRRGMILTTEQEKEFNACTHCPRCKVAFNSDRHRKVRDHDHITGNFRSALCHSCNSKLHLTRRTLPVIFHNFKCYDAHQIIKHGLGKFKHWEIDIIPQTKEKYMQLKARIPVEITKEGKQVYFNINFIDSYQFMSSSLASLVNNLDNLPYCEALQCVTLLITLLSEKGSFHTVI